MYFHIYITGIYIYLFIYKFTGNWKVQKYKSPRSDIFIPFGIFNIYNVYATILLYSPNNENANFGDTLSRRTPLFHSNVTFSEQRL